MPPLPVISGAEAIRAFEKADWVVARQESSHVILIKKDVASNLSVPNHRTLDRGLLRKLIRASGLSIEEFVKNLNS